MPFFRATDRCLQAAIFLKGTQTIPRKMGPVIFHAIPQLLVEGTVEKSNRILGVLAGGDIDEEIVRAWAASANNIIAADAGADLLMRLGITPDATIGDMDSISRETLSVVPASQHMFDQDTTDCDKLLAYAAKEGHPSVTLIGIEGDLPDHVLAILHSAARSSLDIRLAYRRGMGWIVKPRQSRRIATKPGRRVSLLAIEACHGVHLQGTKWLLEDASLSLEHGTSVSNRTEGTELTVSLAKGAALLFVEVPKDELPIW